MKFHQRLVAISVFLFLIATCLLFLGDVFKPFQGNHATHHLTYRESPLRGLKYVRDDHLNIDTRKCFQYEHLKSESNISLVDLRLKNKYDLGAGGDYILPTLIPGREYGSNIQPLKVIIMPHSHNDAGWLRTLEEYYVYTTKNILNNMVDKLRLYPNMTFVWAEAVFLNIWWNELEDDMKVQVRRLVKNGQLEIVSGGWVMPDEASTSYYSIIDQLMEGHQWIMENLKVKPKNSWAIDPFGHSGTVPYLWKKAGLENMVIQRIHQATKGSLAQKKSLEFLWRQPWDNNGSLDILCHVMPYMLYTVKHTCGPNPYVCMMFDFQVHKRKYRKTFAEPISLSNVQEQAKQLYEQYRRKASLYNYDAILVPLGDDFRYDSAQEWDQQYQNYNMLINYMNARDDWKIDVQFGTLKDYFEILRKSEKQKKQQHNDKNFPTVSGDFFPYSDKSNAYWSGYFTTRPHAKKFSREVERNLHAADVLNTLVTGFSQKWNVKYHNYHDISNFLQQSRRNLALFLHHDAITGTSKEYVMQDYENKLFHSFNATQKVITDSAQFLLTGGNLDAPMILEPEEVKTSYDSVTEKRVIHVTKTGVPVILFNTLAKARVELTSLLVDTDKVIVKTLDHQEISYQLNPVWQTSASVHQSQFEIIFLKKLAALSLDVVYLFRADEEIKSVYPAKISIFNSMELNIASELMFEREKPKYSGSYHSNIPLENEYLRAEFDPKTGLLKYLKDKRTGNITRVDLTFMHYKSQGSGAYLFYPSGDAKPLHLGIPIIHVTEGPFMSQIEVVHPNLRHSMKLFSLASEQAHGLHVQNFLNMHANKVRNLQDTEIIMRLNTDIKNTIFFTDQNGFQMIARKNNPNRYVESNYFPLTSMGIMEDAHKRLTIHSAQPHGVAGLAPGQFEVMLDRELMYDDDRGLGEGVQDNRETKNEFVIQIEYLEDVSTETFVQNQQQQISNVDSNLETFTFPTILSMQINDLLQKPIIKMFTSVSTDIFRNRFLPVASPLPCDISLVHLRNLVNSELDYTNSSIVLHRRGFKCGFPTSDVQCSLDSSVSLISIFKDLPVHSVKEVSLTHMYEKRKLLPSSDLNIPPMELTTVQFSLENNR
ncbi:alpha-mannosidase 2-like isoform X2 [Ostrea edulis]|nr:alpha-mannosidase 2-like isoform X2 [Ostrea edulis]XP_048738239.1 alpha-mannosidase 2-like isoform X2 [Ostrea edulis]XP_048738240.1 alpha-mannosidase 2-like isoform X2 [Ostrea edulis]